MMVSSHLFTMAKTSALSGSIRNAITENTSKSYKAIAKDLEIPVSAIIILSRSVESLTFKTLPGCAPRKKKSTKDGADCEKGRFQPVPHSAQKTK